jgi:CHAT domain
LILAAIPHGLRLDKEIREVEECIRRAVKRDMFEIDIRTAVRPQDIRRAIAEEKPQIVHFCGHGLEDGSLLLEDDGGQKKAVPPEGLASLFELHADYVNCVLLNACHSVKSAEAISKYINYAIGMNQEIQDKSAIQFAQGFYDGLGYATSEIQDVFPRAFQEGLVAIKLENLSQAKITVIKTRINIDKSQKPKEVSLVDAISLIVAALGAGALAATKDTAGTAVKDAYQGLKTLIKKKFAEQGKEDDSNIVDKHEKKAGFRSL